MGDGFEMLSHNFTHFVNILLMTFCVQLFFSSIDMRTDFIFPLKPE